MGLPPPTDRFPELPVIHYKSKFPCSVFSLMMLFPWQPSRQGLGNYLSSEAGNVEKAADGAKHVSREGGSELGTGGPVESPRCPLGMDTLHADPTQNLCALVEVPTVIRSSGSPWAKNTNQTSCQHFQAPPRLTGDTRG